MNTNYRTEKVTGGYAIYWATTPARGLANALRVVATKADAEAWIAARNTHPHD